MISDPAGRPVARRADDLQEPPKHVVEFAVEVSGWSPCRSKRGVVIFDKYDIESHGYNYKPRGFDCDGSDACKATCRNEAVHAEQQALLSIGRRASGMDMLHVKTVNGALVASGGPSCVQCSKLALVCGIAGVWLFHEDGWRRYDTADFHQLSILAASPVPCAEPPSDRKRILIDRDAELLCELRVYLNALTITGDNIGGIRRSLFMPWDSQWNGWVRDETAHRELRAPRPPAEGERDEPEMETVSNGDVSDHAGADGVLRVGNVGRERDGLDRGTGLPTPDALLLAVSRDPHRLLDLEPIKARVAAASPLPWTITLKNKADDPNEEDELFVKFGIDWEDSTLPNRADAEFIARSRQDIPALIAEVEYLRARLRGEAAVRPVELLCTFCARGQPAFYLQSGTGNLWHRNEAGQLYKCLSQLAKSAAVRQEE